MNFIKSLLIVGILALSGVAITSCGNSSKTESHAQGKEYTSAYVCPMYCEGSGSDKEGTCPVCGMDYVKNENYPNAHEADNHGHDHHDHSGHDH